MHYTECVVIIIVEAQQLSFETAPSQTYYEVGDIDILCDAEQYTSEDY